MTRKSLDICNTQFTAWWNALQDQVTAGNAEVTFRVNPKGKTQIVAGIGPEIYILPKRLARQMARIRRFPK